MDACGSGSGSHTCGSACSPLGWYSGTCISSHKNYINHIQNVWSKFILQHSKKKEKEEIKRAIFFTFLRASVARTSQNLNQFYRVSIGTQNDKWWIWVNFTFSCNLVQSSNYILTLVNFLQIFQYIIFTLLYVLQTMHNCSFTQNSVGQTL